MATVSQLRSFCKQYTQFLYKEFKFYMYYVEIVTNISRVKLSYTMRMLSKYLKIKVFFMWSFWKWSFILVTKIVSIIQTYRPQLIVHKLKTFEAKAKLTEISASDMIWLKNIYDNHLNNCKVFIDVIITFFIKYVGYIWEGIELMSCI